MKHQLVTAAFVVLTIVSATEIGLAQSIPYPDPFAPAYVPGPYGRYGYGPANTSPNITGMRSEPEADPDEVYLEGYRLRFYTLSLAHPYAAAIDIRVPAGSQLWFQGRQTQQKGSVRFFESPPLEPGKTYAYQVKAVWTDAKGQQVERTRTLQIHAGDYLRIDLRKH